MLTIVTLFINLYRYNEDRCKSLDKYLRWGEYILKLPFDLVIYTDPSMLESIRSIRDEHQPDQKTKIIVYDLPQSTYYKYLDKVKEVYANDRQPDNFSKEKDTPEFVITTWSKLDVLSRAAQDNYFDSKYFAFIDFGLFHIQEDDEYSDLVDILKSITDDKGKSPENDADNEWDRNKIRAMFLKDVSLAELSNRDKYYSQWQYRIAGRFLVGNKDNILKFKHHFDNEILECLAVNRVSLEEGIWGAVYAQNKELFDLYHGDYADVISNYFNFNGGIHCLLAMLEHSFHNGLYETIIKYGMIVHEQILLANYFMIVRYRFVMYKWLVMASLCLQRAGYTTCEGHDLIKIEDLAIGKVISYKTFLKNEDELTRELRESADKFGYKECKCLYHKLSDEVIQVLNSVMDSKLSQHEQHMIENVISDFIE